VENFSRGNSFLAQKQEIFKVSQNDPPEQKGEGPRPFRAKMS
jgi:hypothetical protein